MKERSAPLIVSSLADAHGLAERRKPGHVLSLISPETLAPTFVGLETCNHLVLRFHDIFAHEPDLIAPSREGVRKILDLGNAWNGDAPLLIHCWAGISRSTAAAYVLACQCGGKGEELVTARALRRASPSATPNQLIVQFADELLGRDGAMIRAIAAIGRGSDAAVGTPFDLRVSA